MLQSDDLRAALLACYPPDKLFQAERNFNAAQELDVSMLEGDLVGVIKKKDPMGSQNRWLIDNGGEWKRDSWPCLGPSPAGDLSRFCDKTCDSCPFPLLTVTKGFVYSSFLKPYNPRCSHSDASVGSHSSSESEHSGSSSRSSSTLSSIPSVASVSNTLKPPQDAGSQGDLDSSLQTLAEVDAVCQPQKAPTVESALPSQNVSASRRHSNPDSRNGHLARTRARAAPLLDGSSRLKSSGSKGNQVSRSEV